MKTLVFLLEEHSAEEMLKAVIPAILPADWDVQYLVFNGKQDLGNNILRKMRSWCLPDSKFVILRDQDSGDCRIVKKQLDAICRKSGREDYIVRIACKELETFYLGDLEAVAGAFGMNGLANKQNTRKFRDPDALGNPKQELKGLTKGKYQQLLGSREIASRMKPERNCSHSFRVLIEGITQLTGKK